jgi:riboflavin synthase
VFTGLIQALGTIQAHTPCGGDVRLVINTPAGFLAQSQSGDSIAVSGACLTALELSEHSFAADVSLETLALTTLGLARVGTLVNLELSLRPHDRLGGHFVTGHVDAIGRVLQIEAAARSQRWRFAAPKALAAMVAAKGSIAINGVSLTVNEVSLPDADGAFSFAVNLIPHTLAVTDLGHLQVGSTVNVEVDLLARYLARQHACERWSESEAHSAAPNVEQR